MNTDKVIELKPKRFANLNDFTITQKLKRELYTKPFSNVKHQKKSFKKYLQSNLLHLTSVIHF